MINWLRYQWYRITLSFEDFVVGYPDVFVASVVVLVGVAQMLILD